MCNQIINSQQPIKLLSFPGLIIVQKTIDDGNFFELLRFF